MTKLHYITIVIAVLVLTLTSCSKPIDDVSGDLSGTVSDARNGEPLQGVSITLSPDGRSAVTGSDGRYEFRNIEMKTYTVVASKTNYKSDTKTITIKPGDHSQLDFRLTPSVGELRLLQNALDFGSDVTTLSFDLHNSGTAKLDWQITENVAWLSCQPTNGSIEAGERNSVVVIVNREGLARGNYSQTIAVSSNAGSGVVTITMTVQGISVTVTPSELDFGSTTSTMILSMVNNGSDNVPYSIIKTNDWVLLSKTSGIFTKSDNITVSVDRGDFNEGDYKSSLIITIGDEEIVVPVRMNVPSRVRPIVSLNDVTDITYSSALVKGSVVSIGSSKVTKHGFCWSTQPEPTIDNGQSCNFGDCECAKDISYTISSFEPETTYYIRAYAQNSVGISYSNDERIFTKGLPSKPIVETGIVQKLTDNQAVVSGNILNVGNVPEILQFGHVWSSKTAPTLSDNSSRHGATSMTGTYNSTLTDLQPNHKYYVRAYATNSIGTSYGETITLTTAKGDIELSAQQPKDIAHNKATCQGKILSTGGREISEVGICLSERPNPIVGNDKVVKATSWTDTFICIVTDLTEQTTYYLRCYAMCADDIIFYSNEVKFSTNAKDINIDINDFTSDENWN